MVNNNSKIALIFSAEVNSAISKVSELVNSITNFSNSAAGSLGKVETRSTSLFNNLENKGRQTFGSIAKNVTDLAQGIDKGTNSIGKLNEKIDNLNNSRKALLATQKEEAKREQLARAAVNKFQYASDDKKGAAFGASNLKSATQQRQARNELLGQVKGIGFQGADTLFQSAFRTSLRPLVEDTQLLGSGLSKAFGMGTTAAIGLASVVTVGVVGAIGLAIAAAGELGRQFESAKKDQLALLGISSETQRLFGTDQKTADEFYNRLQIKSEIAGRDTSVEASQINELNTRGFAAFLTTFKNSGKSLEQVSDQMVDINTRYAILAQATPGVTEFQITNAYTSAITGDLGKAIKTQEFFRNSGFAEVIKQVSKDRGVDLNRANRQEQVAILQEALKLRVPQGLIDRAQNDSITAQQSSFMDRLFASRTGIFGIQRDTDLDTEGTQSVFSELSRTFKLVLGKGGLFDQIGEVFGFIDVDVMDGLRRGIQAANDFLELIIKLLNKFNGINQTISSIKVPGTDIQIGGIANTLLSNAFIPNGVLAGNIGGGIKNTVQGAGNLFSQGFDFVKGLFGFGNSFVGNIPDVSNNSSNQSIFAAIANEKAKAPAGSNLLIANDSEYIFKNERQLGDFFKSNYQKLSQNSSSTTTQSEQKINKVYFNSGAIQINTLSQDPEAIARLVIEKIDKAFNFELEATL